MTTTQKLDEKCGHGLAAWRVDGKACHERADQTVALDGTRMESRGLMVDFCDSPPIVSVAKKVRR